MAKLKQSGAMVLLALLILISYYIFDQQDLINTTEIARYKCLNSQPPMNPALCISCIKRSQFGVGYQSSIYVKDPVNQFKVLALPSQGVLTCEELIQFVSYQLPMKTAKDIKIEQLGSTQQIIKMLGIKVTPQPVSKYQASITTQTLAILQLKLPQAPQSTIFTYSSQQSQSLSRYYGKTLSQCSLVFAIFCIFYYKFQQGEVKIGFIGVITISLMVLGETMLSNCQYLVDYAISLTVGFYFTKALVSRIVTLVAILVSLAVSVYLASLYSEFLCAILVMYLLVGLNKSFKKVGTFGIFCFTVIIICAGFKEHHHWLSLPLRKIMQYTILTLSPLLMEIVSNTGVDPNYNQIPTGSSSSSQAVGVSLPGFEEDVSSDQDQK